LQLATDPSGNLYAYLSDNAGYIAEVDYSSDTAKDFYLLTAPYGDASFSYSIAADANGNLYTAAEINPSSNYSGLCAIYGQNKALSDGLTSGPAIWPVAGNRNCGYSGDGGPATGAEIGNELGQFAWDPAGDFYFTDTNNGAVRRIDAYSGIIHTVAGTGVFGYTGDGGPATSATLWDPLGLAVDAEGNVYTSAFATNNTSAVREIGGAGQLVFLPQVVGVASSAQTILVTDTGSAPLNLYKATFTAGNVADFTLDPVTTNCSFTVALYPGQTCKIGVIFKPTVAGNRSAVITLTDDTLNANDIIQVSGVAGTTPAKAVLSPAAVTYPAQQIGTTSAYTNITLANTGGLPLEISGLVLTGANKTDFGGGTNCDETLAPGASCVTSLVFAPTVVGPATAAVTFTTSLGTLSVPLTGTGVTTAHLSTTAITFPAQTVGVASATQTVTLTNTGKTALTISGSSLSATQFKTTANTCASGTVASGASCSYLIAFTPPSVGAYTGTFTVNTSAGALTATLAGSGVLNTSLTPATSAASIVKLTNTASTPLTLTTTSIVGGQFNPSDQCTASLAAGASCNYSITFTPSYVGSVETTLTVNTGRGPLYAILIGASIAATPAVKLASAANPAAKGEIIKLTTTVTNSSRDLPTGTVELLEGSTVLAKETLVDGKVTFDLSNLAPGTHTLTSHYLGDKLHNPSTSSPLLQVVGLEKDPRPVLPVRR
jgi:hypothetical protein